MESFVPGNTIASTLTRLRAHVNDIAHACGRTDDPVTIVAVSKTKPVSLIEEAVQAGHLDFGENRVQEMAEKQTHLPPTVRWHQIGQLQTNKVKLIAPFVHLIHSLDSEKLAEEINKQAEKYSRIIPCLIQINISDEMQKSGMTEVEAEGLIQTVERFPFLRITGLMGIAEFTDNEGIIRNQFRRLRLASESFQKFNGPQIEMKELSMGMSHDFALAIAEGATMIRVGSLIFGSR
jgi:PLP dependent protein